MSPVDDRRDSARHPILLRVDYEGDTQFLHDYTENLSRGGLFVATARSFEIGDTVKLILSFPGLLTPFRVEGHVRWVRPSSAPPDKERGIGVELSSDSGAPECLATLVDKVRSRDPLVVEQVRTYRVLVVEDNEHVRFLLREGLRAVAERRREERVSFQFDEVASADGALGLLAERSYDLLVIDLYLPGMDGITLIRRLRADERFVSSPILAISAGGEAALEAAKEAGADLCLAKPLLVRSFFETVLTLLRNIPKAAGKEAG